MRPTNGRLFDISVLAALMLHIAAIVVLSMSISISHETDQALEFIPVEFSPEQPTVEKVAVKPKLLPSPSATNHTPHPTRPESMTRNTPSLPRSSEKEKAGSGTPIKRVGVGVNLTEANGSNTSTGGLSSAGHGNGTGSGQGNDNGFSPGEGDDVVVPRPSQAPREVSTRVCALSGDLPGPHCENIAVRKFLENRQPVHICTLCKPQPKPEPPPHKSIQATVIKEKLLNGPKPSIPASVRLSSIDASVTCRWAVGVDGSTTNVEITSSSGIPALDQAVLDAVKRWRYSPALQNGVPRVVHKSTMFVFKR